MSHTEFVSAYQKCSLGYCMSTMPALRTLLSEGISRREAGRCLVRWFGILLVLFAGIFWVSPRLPLICTILLCAYSFCCVAFLFADRVAELAITYALIDRAFYLKSIDRKA